MAIMFHVKHTIHVQPPRSTLHILSVFAFYFFVLYSRSVFSFYMFHVKHTLHILRSIRMKYNLPRSTEFDVSRETPYFANKGQ